MYYAGKKGFHSFIQIGPIRTHINCILTHIQPRWATLVRTTLEPKENCLDSTWLDHLGPRLDPPNIVYRAGGLFILYLEYWIPDS